MANVNFGGLTANMGPFAPVSIKGNANVNGVPVFVDKLPLTMGGLAGGEVHYGRVVSIDPTNRRYFVEGVPTGNIVKGIAIYDPARMRSNPGMQDYYFPGDAIAVVTFGIIEISDYDTTQGAPMEGSTVYVNNTTGKLAFGDGAAPAGYTAINAYVYESLDPNGAKIFLNFPAVTAQTRETTTQVATPTATPAAGSVAAGTVVHLASTTTGAKILYTLDGTTPGFDSLVYDASTGINVSAAVTIKAIAVAEGNDPSAMLTAAYTIA